MPSAEPLLLRILRAFEWECGWEDLERDVRTVARVIEDDLALAWGAAQRSSTRYEVDVLPSVFYRNKGAYVVGRIRRAGGPGGVMPLVLALLNGERGVFVDAVLTTSDEASIVFGFTWSYFRVDVPHPRAMVEFLKSIMPLKPIGELYTSIGFNKHGKTELYRAIVKHLERADATFEVAEGEPGLVMSVFTLPAFNVVFKIIKDRFGEGKRTTREEVRAKYQLVFVRDRVGRLADAQEFEHLAFRRECFAAELLAELLRDCGRTVRLDGDSVVVAHLYTERRVMPLNLYVRAVSAAAAREAVLDYGRAIKDLAAAGIFTGDMLMKNFGVTRHGRVIFYDYDELCLLEECVFREIPRAAGLEEELSAEPWFYVGDRDIFPEEFAAFLVPAGPLRDAFLERHGDLLTVEFWRRMQERRRNEEVMDVFPYREGRRLR